MRVDSAGTHSYHVGAPPDRRAQTAAARRGIDISMLQARRVAVHPAADVHEDRHLSRSGDVEDHPHLGGIDGLAEVVEGQADAEPAVVQPFLEEPA